MSLFEDGMPEKILLLVRNFNMTLAVSGKLEAGAKIQYLCNLFNGEALHQFEPLSSDAESTKTLNVDDSIKVSAQYFPPVNFLSKQNRAMHRGMKKMRANCKTLCGAYN